MIVTMLHERGIYISTWYRIPRDETLIQRCVRGLRLSSEKMIGRMNARCAVRPFECNTRYTIHYNTPMCQLLVCPIKAWIRLISDKMNVVPSNSPRQIKWFTTESINSGLCTLPLKNLEHVKILREILQWNILFGRLGWLSRWNN